VTFKIKGGTTSDQTTSLCLSCRSATIISGPRLADRIIACSQLEKNDRITFVVTSCTSYSDKSLPSLYHMEDIAWILRSDPKRKQVGFVRSRNLAFEERHVLEE
jgi:hypothetical protein